MDEFIQTIDDYCRQKIIDSLNSQHALLSRNEKEDLIRFEKERLAKKFLWFLEQQKVI